MTTDIEPIWAEITRLRDRVDSLEATIDVLSDPELLAQHARSLAEIERGEPTYTLDDVTADRASRRIPEAS